jgi:hypothetical protein
MLRQRVASDAALRPLAAGVVRRAELLIDQPPVEHLIRGTRLLDVSRTAVARIVRLGMAYHLTGDDRFAHRFAEEADAIAGFPDFGPNHYLDVAEMATALGIGLDWFKEALPKVTRERVVQALREKVIATATDDQWWWGVETNWSAVCMAGVLVACRAILQDGPDSDAQRLADRVRSHAKAAFACYEPDGVYPEGPTYWSYGTIYAIVLLETLRSMGHEEIAATLPGDGFLRSAGFRAACDGPSGAIFNFGDTHSKSVYVDPSLFWFAERHDRPELLDLQRQLLRDENDTNINSTAPAVNFLPMILAWMPQQTADATEASTDWSGGGLLDVAIHRRGVNDLYVAIKSGGGDLPHGQLDAGSFVLDVAGSRIATDLGAEDYYTVEQNVPGFWEKAADAGRWTLLRYQNQFHNTITVAGRPHDPFGRARMISHAADESVFNLGPPLGDAASAATRRVRVTDDAVRFHDEILEPVGEVTWTMVTEAEVEEAADGFRLTANGIIVSLSAADPETAAFSRTPLDQLAGEFDSPNPGVSVLRIVRPEAAVVVFDIEVKRA